MLNCKNLIDMDSLIENKLIKFSFIPEIYILEEFFPISSTLKNRCIIQKLIGSSDWEDFIEYLFNDLRPYILPYYTPEMYYLDNISSHIETENGVIVFVIIGKMTKYSLNEVKNKYMNDFAINKTWSEIIDKKMTVGDFYDLIGDGFYKFTQEGEWFIKGIGQLSLSAGTSMCLSFVSDQSGGYGPGSKDLLKISLNLSKFIKDCTRYVSQLSVWKQYLLWRYTIGSGSINKELIGIANEGSKIIWTYQFFKYYNDDLNLIELPFISYVKNFSNAQRYLKFGKDKKILIADQIIELYIAELQKIILGGPITKGSIIVYKVSSEYPELPSKSMFSRKIVFQKPFNSTTFDSQFNFSLFLGDNDDCCFFTINIPDGSHVLYIPTEFHAYPFENEILLPFGSQLDFFDHYIDDFSYVLKKEIKLRQIQDKPYHVGPVHELDPTFDPNILTKKMNIFLAHYINPEPKLE